MTMTGTSIDAPDTPKQRACRDRRHQPDMHIVRAEGVYVHICPNCDKAIQFRVKCVPWRGANR